MKKLWFTSKQYGWGWTPSTWQGWVVLGIYLILVMAGELVYITQFTEPGPLQIIGFVIYMVIITVGLVLVCYATGEKPHWQWGKPKK